MTDRSGGSSGGNGVEGGGGEPAGMRPHESPLAEGEDEPPGAYLAELGAGAANVAWGFANLVLVIALGTAAAALGMGPGSPWHAFSRLVWSLLPISSIILIIVTVWQAGNAYASPAAGKAAVSIALGAASLGAWLVFRFALGVLPPS